MARTKNASKILERITDNDSAIKAEIANARMNFEVAQMIYDGRTKAGLSQRQLADLIGSKQPVIARLEDADYEGHSLSMLQRIAEALQQRLEVRFVPARVRPVTSKRSRQRSRRPLASRTTSQRRSVKSTRPPRRGQLHPA